MSASKPSKPAREPQRIAKLLARAGIASRREIERMIAEGRIALDGKPLETPATLLTSLRGVTVDGKPVAQPAPARLFIFHKPSGVLTTERDPKGRRTIYDVLPGDLPRLVPVGRLDMNTEGLLLMTSDGELKRQLELPATGVERTYRARAFGPVTQAQLEELSEGVEIDGIRYGSIDANLERRTGANSWIEMTLTEGKNREIRRVLEHLGLEVSRLIRVRYGPFVLGDLPVGAIGEVRQHDLVAFRKTLRLPPERRSYAPVAATPAKPKTQDEPGPSPSREGVGAGQRRQGLGSAPQRAPFPAHTAPSKGRGHKVVRPDDAPAKPARAARAKAFREARGPREGDLVERPRTPRPARGPAAGRGKPARPPRPPRTRK